MFFLLYVPPATSPDAHEQVKAQLEQMLTTLQDTLEQAGLIELDPPADADPEQAENPAQLPANAAVSELETPELTDMRDYLERCFKKPA